MTISSRFNRVNKHDVLLGVGIECDRQPVRNGGEHNHIRPLAGDLPWTRSLNRNASTIPTNILPLDRSAAPRSNASLAEGHAGIQPEPPRLPRGQWQGRGVGAQQPAGLVKCPGHGIFLPPRERPRLGDRRPAGA